MKETRLLKIAEEAGFKSIDDFVRYNLKYLPRQKQRIFYGFYRLDKALYKRDCYGKG